MPGARCWIGGAYTEQKRPRQPQPSESRCFLFIIAGRPGSAVGPFGGTFFRKGRHAFLLIIGGEG
jgi:hypothetical protein